MFGIDIFKNFILHSYPTLPIHYKFVYNPDPLKHRQYQIWPQRLLTAANASQVGSSLFQVIKSTESNQHVKAVTTLYQLRYVNLL